MEFSTITIKVIEDGIRQQKVFQGMKIYSRTIPADDQTTITHQRIYTTTKGNFVFHQHTRPNWEGYWREDENRAMPQGVTESTVLKICSNLNELDGTIPTPVLASLASKVAQNEIVEHLDI